MPGCGKSTIGKYIAEKLGREFLDLDEYIVSFSGRTIAEMFEEGEPVFRREETNSLRAVAQKEALIVATGGGVVVTPGNEEIMRKSGTVIFIDSSVESILKNSALEGRPLLKNKNRIFDLYNNRIGLYRSAATYTVENNGFLSDACDEIERIIKHKTDM